MGNSIVNNLASDLSPAFGLDGTAITDQTTTVDDTAGGVAMIGTALDARTDYVFWSIKGADARFTIDSSAPVGGSNGHFVADKSSGIWSKEMANAAKWIRDGSTSATLHISELQKR